jgi:Flp pilus assembly protein TadG
MKPPVTRLTRDKRGAAILEFALVAPLLLTLVLGAFDLGYRAYITSVLQGAVQKAARDATIEGGADALSSIDAAVYGQVHPVISNGTLTFDRKNYATFTRAGQAENFTDTNNNNVRDPGECFQDENGNNTWDADGGANGLGGARDIVVYTAKLTYPHIFPVAGFLGWSETQTVSSTTVLRNQPFGTQANRNTTVVCT